jgi:hypothetical protein
VVARFARQTPDVRIIAVAHRSARPADVQRFWKERGLAGSPVVLRLDPKGTLAKRYRLDTYPQFVAFDAKGKRLGVTYALLEILPRLARK